MAWIHLVIAGILEVTWAIGLKYSEGFTRVWATAATVVAMLASFAFLSMAVRALPVGTAYAVWTGIGAAGTALLGMVLFGEPRNVIRLACIGLIVVGMIGLKLTSAD